jgi:transposase
MLPQEEMNEVMEAAVETQTRTETESPEQTRLAWMLCYAESKNVQEVCKKFSISKKTFYKWLKRYKASNGDSASLSDRSRRPHRSPRSTPDAVVSLLRRAKDETGYGQRRLRTYLAEYHNIIISERTIWKILKRSNGQSGLNGFSRG